MEAKLQLFCGRGASWPNETKATYQNLKNEQSSDVVSDLHERLQMPPITCQ